MADLGLVPWPPGHIETERLLVRQAGPSDSDGYDELMGSDEVRRYLGGPRHHESGERASLNLRADRPGAFAVEADRVFIGVVTVDRRDTDRPGHVGSHGNELEISYLFLPSAWGNGYATEAVRAVLSWIERVLPEEPVVVCTQAANDASVRVATRLGFVEQEQFVEFDERQWFGVRAAESLQH